MELSNESSRKFNMVIDLISCKKEKENEITDISSGEKDNFLLENMEIEAYDSIKYEDGSIKKQDGTIIPNIVDFAEAKKSIETIKKISERLDKNKDKEIAM